MAKRIGLLSDTHSYLDERIFHYFEECDEVWHAGDIGDLAVTDALKKVKSLRAVYGNIDNAEARLEFPEHLKFRCEGVKVWITHIGGYPGRYAPAVRDMIKIHTPNLFICGHSHILKVMNDKKLNLLHMNPGAAGTYGIQKVRTLLRFEISGEKIQNLEVIEFKKKS